MSPQRIIPMVVLLFVLGGLIVAASRSRNSPRPQQPDRLIEQKSAPNEPLKIVAVSNQRAKLKIGAKFSDDEEWLKGFTLEVRNTHAKAIKFVSIELLFPRRQGQTEPPVSTTLTYGEDPSGPSGSSDEAKLLLPGESVNLRLSDTQHQNLCAILSNEKYDESIGQVRLRLEEVLFGDGTKWLAGMFFRRDGLNPDQWVPIEDTTPKPRLHHPIRSPPPLQLEGRSMDFPAWMVPAKSTNLSLATLACEGHYVSSEWIQCFTAGCSVSEDVVETSPPRHRLLAILNKRNPSDVLDAIEKGAANVEPPMGRSQEWKEGFRLACKSIEERVKRAQKKGQLAQELRQFSERFIPRAMDLQEFLLDAREGFFSRSLDDRFTIAQVK